MSRPDPKPEQRIVDPRAIAEARLRYRWCAACGARAGSIHHIVQKGSPHFGDDVLENLLGLCGDGTTGCHGAYHGTPYTAVGYATGPAFGPDWQERRDAEWVARRIGRHLMLERQDAREYILRKIGDPAGWAFLERAYFVEL